MAPRTATTAASAAPAVGSLDRAPRLSQRLETSAKPRVRLSFSWIRRWPAQSGIGVGVAAVVALDLYCLPLVRDDGPPAAQDALAIIACLITAALVGELAAQARRRALKSEGEARVLASELAASRARIVTSSNQARQRIERDLHDGVQQRLVSLALDVCRAETLAEQDQLDLRAQLSELRVGLVGAVDDLREVARGIHPAILTDGGLRPALAKLARRSPVPVELTVRGLDRVPEAVEVCVYYVVSEALTNALKHAQATVVTVELDLDDSMVDLVVCDDGVGGADVRAGSGLIGMSDRLEALGGAIGLWSPANQGTRLEARVPLCAEERSSDGHPWHAGLLVTSASARR